MNYQLLIESYSYGTNLTNQEIELLSIELETQIMNMDISTNLSCFKPAPLHVCKKLNLRKNSYWIICLAQILDIHKTSKIKRTKSAEVFELMLKKGLAIC